MKLMLLSGPPKCGKDTAAKDIWRISPYKTYFNRFSAPLKQTFAALANKDINEFFEVDFYEEHKDEIIPWLGVSFRQYQINLSEKHFKPLYGEDIFARIFTNTVKEYVSYGSKSLEKSIVVVPDLGFKIETEYLEKHFYLEDLLLVRIHRQGYDFSGDSRSYVYSNNMLSLDITNNTSEAEYQEKMYELHNSFINHKDVRPFNEQIRVS